MHFWERRGVGAAVALAIVTGSLIGQSSGPANAHTTTPLNYVALGDSFSSGLGLDNPVKGAPDYCHRSLDNYPHRVAAALDLKLTDVTCAGAITANIISTPLKYGGKAERPQITALSSATDVVTITIGGNDLGFVTVARSCIALRAEGPLLLSVAKNCRSEYVKKGVDSLVQRLQSAVLGTSTAATSGLTATFARIRHDAPNAKVFVVGYPSIMPNAANIPEGGCFGARLAGKSLDDIYADNIFPFTSVDTKYVNSLEQELNATEQAAAQQAGFTFVSTLAESAAHSACAPAAERYVNAVSLYRDAKNSLQLDPGSLHPNTTGTRFLTEALTPVIAKAIESTTPTPAHSAAPAATGSTAVVSIATVSALGVLLAVMLAVMLAVLLVRRSRRRRE